ncbi:8254_t:CDS:2, partial [Gigaspora rosea]
KLDNLVELSREASDFKQFIVNSSDNKISRSAALKIQMYPDL